MSDERAYRVELRFTSEGNVFVASAKELGLTASGASRADAVAALEAEIDARIQAAADGDALPRPADLAEVDGKLTIQLAAPIARELLYAARAIGTSPEVLAAQLVARGIGGPTESRPRRDRDRREDAPAEATESDERPRGADRGGQGQDRGSRDRNRGNAGGRDRRREGYRPELDDKANFMEYLRGLDKGGPTRNRGGNSR